jgi:hypothetical protein
MLNMDCPGLPTQEGCSSTGPRQPGAVTSSAGDWSVRAIQVTHRRRTSSRRACDRRCRTGRVGRTSGLELQCTAQPGPAAAGLGTSGGVGPGTDVEPAHAASAGGPGREPPMLGGRGALTRGWRRRYKGTCGGHRWGPQAESWTDCGVAGARTRMAGVFASLGWAASLDCSEGSKERDAGRARLDRVEGGDPRRTGPGWDP